MLHQKTIQFDKNCSLLGENVQWKVIFLYDMDTMLVYDLLGIRKSK